MNDKIILTDCDGVLLDWSHGFKEFMASKGLKPIPEKEESYNIGERFGFTKAKGKEFVAEFNNSVNIKYLTPYLDSMYYVKKLHEEHGFVFNVITSLSSNPYAKLARYENLVSLFPKSAINSLVCLPTGGDKDEALEPYRDSECWWIEDSGKNIDLGRSLGLKGILMHYPHNKETKAHWTTGNFVDNPGRALNWKNVYQFITGSV